MDMEEKRKFLEQIKRHEGLRLEAYLCPAGKLTVGYGHNCESSPVAGVEKPGDRIRRKDAENLLASDAARCAEQLSALRPAWRKMNAPRQAVLINMGFNMGITKLMAFKKMWAALERDDFLRASSEMLDSKWAREDVPRRAGELACQMQTGQWQEGA